MWLARESLPYLARILTACSRLVLALLVGAALLVVAVRGGSVRAVPGVLELMAAPRAGSPPGAEKPGERARDAAIPNSERTP
jgi:hypothetical protein